MPRAWGNPHVLAHSLFSLEAKYNFVVLEQSPEWPKYLPYSLHLDPPVVSILPHLLSDDLSIRRFIPIIVNDVRVNVGVPAREGQWERRPAQGNWR